VAEINILSKYITAAQSTDPVKYAGYVTRIQGLLIESRGPQAQVGEVCRIETQAGRTLAAEVVGVREAVVQLMAYDETTGLQAGDRVVASGRQLEIPVSMGLLGHVLNYKGDIIDKKSNVNKSDVNNQTSEELLYYPAMAAPPDALTRPDITQRIVTGIRAIDGLLAVGKGQRLGLFAGSGVGKSTLMGMIARNTNADVNVIALIGERGREVNDFISKDLGEDGLKRSVVVATTSDSSHVARIRGAYTATAVAEYFRDQGKDVMLLFDSIYRFAESQAEVGLATGEPPRIQGYPPSVFSSLPRLLERSGTSEKGSITAFYTVLVQGEDMDDPIADNVRAIVDGHIVLSRRLQAMRHYPAVDVPASISRLDKDVTGPNVRKAANYLARLIATYADAEVMIDAGAYKTGSNPAIDEAIEKHDRIEKFLCQDIGDKAPLDDTLKQLSEITGVTIPPEELK
jgi:flagellum-specific ATP synthase